MTDVTTLIDVHAHFHTERTGRSDWKRYNESRLAAGRYIGVSCHVASVLGSWGTTSPTYFPSPEDLTFANSWMTRFANESNGEVRAFIAINPNHPEHALSEVSRGMSDGAIGIKIAASRRADDALLDDVAAAAAAHGVPILHHIWQHRRRDWPNQDASDGVELARLATRHPAVTFILAHIGGGGDWAHTNPAVLEVPNIVMDLSGSGIDRGMMDEAVHWVSAKRVLWAADLTLCTGLTKLRALETMGFSPDDIADIRWRNAVRCFPAGSFERAMRSGMNRDSNDASAHFASADVGCWIGPYPFREVPHPDPEILVKVLAREGFASAWVGYLPGAFHRDPSPANRRLFKLLSGYADVLRPAPIVRPDWPGWQQELASAVNEGAPAIRAYPAQWGFGPGHGGLGELAYACGEAGIVLQLTVRFEDLRQRHQLDTAGDLTGAAVRAIARLPQSRCHLMVLGGGRELIEEIHWGLTVLEQSRVWYDFGWTWGPPEDHFASLIRTMGGKRFVVGSAWPLRLTQQSRALVDLLPQPLKLNLQLAEGRDIEIAAKHASSIQHPT